MPVRDSMVVLEMPGRILVEINEVADAHFLSRSKMPLQEFVSRGVRGDFLVMLEGAAPEDEVLCPLNRLYEELIGGKPRATGLIALKYVPKIHPQDVFDIYLIHARLVEEGKMSVRLLPFPSTWMLRISRGSDLWLVEVPPMYSRTFSEVHSTPALIASVLSSVWDKIHAGPERGLPPSGFGEDYCRYLKLLTSLEILEEADAFTGWAAMGDATAKEIVADGRDDLYERKD